MCCAPLSQQHGPSMSQLAGPACRAPTTYRAHLYNCHSQLPEASSSHSTAPAVGYALVIASSSCAGDMPQAWVQRRYMACGSPLTSTSCSCCQAHQACRHYSTHASAATAGAAVAGCCCSWPGALATGTGSCHFTGPCLPCPPWSCWAPGCSASPRCVQGLSPGA